MPLEQPQAQSWTVSKPQPSERHASASPLELQRRAPELQTPDVQAPFEQAHTQSCAKSHPQPPARQTSTSPEDPHLRVPAEHTLCLHAPASHPQTQSSGVFHWHLSLQAAALPFSSQRRSPCSHAPWPAHAPHGPGTPPEQVRLWVPHRSHGCVNGTRHASALSQRSFPICASSQARYVNAFVKPAETPHAPKLVMPARRKLWSCATSSGPPESPFHVSVPRLESPLLTRRTSAPTASMAFRP